MNNNEYNEISVNSDKSCLLPPNVVTLPLRKVTTFFMQTINITVPKGWHELSQKQLRYVFFLLSEEYTVTAIKTQIFMKNNTSCNEQS